jgi:SulP family sulfate permease
MLLASASRPHVAFLGRIPGTRIYSDNARHPENELLLGVIAFRPEASLLYINAASVLEAVLDCVQRSAGTRLAALSCVLLALMDVCAIFCGPMA